MTAAAIIPAFLASSAHVKPKCEPKKSGNCQISNEEIINIPFVVGRSFEQTILAKLKDKGAPVLGLLNLKLDPKYLFMSYRDNSTLSHHYQWKKLNA